MRTNRVPVFVDCDNTMGLPGQEIDDGLTILYLLAQPGVEVVGISATHGNGSIDEVMASTRALLDRVGRDIPLYRGAGPSERSRSEAARALVRAASEYSGRLVVLGLGALSSIAGAGEIDAGFYRRLASIKVMGGYLAPLLFRREVRELNFSADPEAAHAVLHAPAPITVMSAQLCLAARFGRRELLFHNRGPTWLRRSVRDWARTFGAVEGRVGFYLWDLLPAVAVLQPERFPSRLVRLRSGVDELRTGSLRFDTPEPEPSAATPLQSGPEHSVHSGYNVSRDAGVVDLPETIIGSRRFAAECAAAWSRAARGA